MKTIPKIPDKYRFDRIPNGNVSVEKLFTFFVRKMCLSGRANEYLMHNQIGNLIFNNHNSTYLKQIVSEYKPYFEYLGRKKRLNIEKVYTEHTYIWTGEKVNSREFSLQEILSAIQDEINQTKKEQAKKYIKIINIKFISKLGSSFIYTAKVFIENDEFISFPEGVKVRLKKNSDANNWVTVLEYNNQTELLSFQSTKKLNIESAKIQLSTLWLLYKLKDVIEKIEPNDNPVWKLVQHKKFPNEIGYPKEILTDNLGNTQLNAIKRSLKNDITYIWGPPGTGKSFTLARLLLNLLNNNQRTVVCSIANVAVDGLLMKTIELINEHFKKTRIDFLKENRIIRLGYSQSEEIRNIPQIKFESTKLLQISAELQAISEKLKNLVRENKEQEKIKLTLLAKKDELKKLYDKESKGLISDSNLIFLTTSKFIVENSLHDMSFDNLIVDEGSMMSIPFLLAVGSNIKKRIIISGDFKQLGPISASKSSNAKKWLHNDLFWLLADDDKKKVSHNALIMLNEQRRSAKELIGLINESFYNGKLNTIPQLSHSRTKDFPPKKGHVVFVNLQNNEENVANFSKNHSKYNSYSRKKVVDIIQKILNVKTSIRFNIAVITPYRQQVLDYKKNFHELGFDNQKVKVGTIHTFQGSESDIVIWDIVDTINQPIGSLYKYDVGERLVNVAISRAKSKLIIVGYNRIFQECDGRDNISMELKRILGKAWNLYIKQIQTTANNGS